MYTQKSLAQRAPSRSPTRVIASTLAVLVIAFSFQAAVQAAGPRTPEALKQHVAASFRKAPVLVVYQAVLSGTGYDTVIDVEVSELLSGDFAGSIDSVLDEINRELSLSIEFSDSRVTVRKNVPENLQAPIVETVSAVVSNVSSIRSESVSHSSIDPKPVTSSSLKTIQKPAYVDSDTRSDVQGDQIVERMFVLQHAYAVDKQLANDELTVIPGVASQVRQFAAGSMASVIALPSMNALVIKDRESNMARYKQLISSIDRAFVDSHESKLLNQSPRRERVWTIVR